AAVHDDLATQTARAEAAGFKVTGFKTTKEGGVDVQTKAKSVISSEETKPLRAMLMKNYGLTSEAIASADLTTARRGRAATAQDVKEGRASKVDEFTNKYTGAETGDLIQFNTPGGPVTMKHADFQSAQRAFGSQPLEKRTAPAKPVQEGPQSVHYDFRTP